MRYYHYDLTDEFTTIPCVYTPVYSTGNGYSTQYRVQLCMLGNDPIGVEVHKSCKREGHAYTVSVGCFMLGVCDTVKNTADSAAASVERDMRLNFSRTIPEDERKRQRVRIANALTAFA